MNQKLLLGIGLFILAAAALVWSLRGCVTVVVRNVGNAPLRSPVVEVTGRSFPIPDLAPGESRSVKVRPTGESHLEITHALPDGSRKRIRIGCYFEADYGGSIKVDVDSVADEAVKVDNKIRIGPYW